MKMARKVEHGNLSKAGKIQLLTDFFISSDFAIDSSKTNAKLGTRDYVLRRLDGSILVVHAIIKNISSGGWSWKPMVKRIQVKAFDRNVLPPISRNEIVLLGGFALVDDDYVFAAWNIFAYMTQKTVRSCYISADILAATTDAGFCSAWYSDNRVYTATRTNMAKLLDVFISENAVTII